MLAPGKNFRRALSLVVTVAMLAGAFTTPTATAQNNTDPASAITIPPEATVESLFRDFLHYAKLGRFTAADAYARALLAHPDLNPVELLGIASQDPTSLDTLLILIRNSTIGNSASRVMKLLERGEHEKRKDPNRIRRNIAMLGGNPQQEFFARKALADSGEYAIPFMVEALLDRSQANLRSRLITALPAIGKAAVNPLVIALSVDDDDVRQHLITALGEIGYPQAIPYLRKLLTNPTATPEGKRAAGNAITRIESITGRDYPGSADEMFFKLTEAYYNEDDAVRGDPRLDEANVWYWDATNGGLRRAVVSTPIFGPVMAMRCAEESLMLRNDSMEAIALWLAADVRRESRLGMNIESADPDDTGQPDATRPDIFPRALYFLQAAGPRYAHAVLDRAVKDNDSAVALGAIRALDVTAGETSLVGSEGHKQPLVQALKFPDLVVRIRSALALGAALPRSTFDGAELVVPMLSATLNQSGRAQLLVVDNDQDNANRVASAVRGGDREAISGTNFYATIERARVELQVVSGIFLSTDIENPGLTTAMQSLRSEFLFSKTPVVVLVKPGQFVLAEELALVDAYVEVVDSRVDDSAIEAAFERAASRTGQMRIDEDLALSLAIEAAQTLRAMAVNGRTIYDVSVAESALIAALGASDERLQTLVASVLALLPTSTAQRAIAHVALDDTATDTLRIAAFGSLAESAKANGNRIESDQVTALVDIARGAADLTIRTAASQALGALNLTSNQASHIIRSYYGG